MFAQWCRMKDFTCGTGAAKPSDGKKKVNTTAFPSSGALNACIYFVDALVRSEVGMICRLSQSRPRQGAEGWPS